MMLIAKLNLTGNLILSNVNGIILYVFLECGPGSVVGIATGYGLDSRGIESRWGRDFLHLPDWPWGPPSLLYNGYRVFPGG